MLIYEELTREILGAATEVHKEIGPGLLESAYVGFLMNFNTVLMKDDATQMIR